MHVDIEGATQIARLAAEFDWTWAVDDLEPFCAQAGWELVELRHAGGSIRTNFHVSRPTANMFGRQHGLMHSGSGRASNPVRILPRELIVPDGLATPRSDSAHGHRSRGHPQRISRRLGYGKVSGLEHADILEIYPLELYQTRQHDRMNQHSAARDRVQGAPSSILLHQ